MSKTLDSIAGLMIIGGTIGLYCVAAKAEKDLHKTKQRLTSVEYLVKLHEIREVLYKSEIRTLKEELEKCKKSEES